MVRHPLREILNLDDWKRIQDVMDGLLPHDSVSSEEIEAANDLLFDVFAFKNRTHHTVGILQ